MPRNISTFGPPALAFLWVALLGAPAFAQTSSPPPFVLPPPAPAADATAQPEVPVVQRAKMDQAHAQWQVRDGGADYHTSLTYLRGKPVLMLITETDESGSKALHRKRAIVQACGFLLDDTTFERAVVCIVEVDLRKPDKPRVRNHDLQRTVFQTAAKNATQTIDAKDALRKAWDDDAPTLRICADLGID